MEGDIQQPQNKRQATNEAKTEDEKAAASKATKPTSAKTAKPMAAKAVKPAAKLAAPKSRKKVSSPVPAKSLKAPVAKIGNPVSPVVKLRGKVIGAHARSAGSRNEARRGKR